MRLGCGDTVDGFEERASRELRGVLEAAGWADAEQYSVQVLFNGFEPVCPTAQQLQKRRQFAERLAREMGFPLSLLASERDLGVREAGHAE